MTGLDIFCLAVSLGCAVGILADVVRTRGRRSDEPFARQRDITGRLPR